MPIINIGVDKEAWDSQFVVLPPRDYIVEVKQSTIGESRQKKSPQLELVYGIIDPQTVSVEGKEVNISKQKLFNVVSLVPKAASFLRQALVGHGVPFQLEGGMCQFDPDAFIGKRVVVSVGVEKQDNGKERNVVNKVRLAD
jgi:hypothetical protein